MLNASELRQALNSAGYQLNCRILNVLVHRYGTKDGQITFDDFIASAVRLKCMIGKIAYEKMLISLFFQKFFLN